jgi:hypothetical protein
MPVLMFPIQAQRAKEWCWIAAAVCTDHYYNRQSTWDQNSLANALLGLSNCSTSPVPDPCNVPGELKRCLGFVGRLRTAVTTPILLNGIKSEIDATDPVGRPICAGIDWSDADIGHAVIICGYDNVSGTDYVYVADPGSGSVHHLPFDSFLNNYEGKGKWVATYFTEP